MGKADCAKITKTPRAAAHFWNFCLNALTARQTRKGFCVRVSLREDDLPVVGRMDDWPYAILRATLNDHYRKSAWRRRLAEGLGGHVRQIFGRQITFDVGQHIVHVAIQIISCEAGRDATRT